MDICYELDRRQRISGISGPWDQFALNNNGEAAQSHLVLGRSLWAFISDMETMDYLESIFSAVIRKGLPFRTTYSCRGPVADMTMRMCVSPAAHGGLRISNRVIAHHPVTCLNTAPRGVATANGTRCTICAAFRIGDEWIATGNRPLSSAFPRDGRTFCSECADLKRHSGHLPHMAREGWSTRFGHSL